MSADLVSLIDSLIPPLGWTIVHSLWQGCVFAVLLAALLRAMRAAPPAPRYVVCCAALALMVAATVTTFVVLKHRAAELINDVAPAAPVAMGVALDVGPTAAAMVAPVPQEPELQPLRYVVTAWLIGVAALSLWHVGGWMWLQSMRRGPAVQAWQAAVDRLSDSFGIRRAVRLVESLHIDVPAVVGMLRPVILVPVGILNDLSARQVEAILAHELAHVRRHDYLVNLLQAAVETLLFYHPATWWISRRIREERENCCDDLATRWCGDATLYASALAALEERRLPPPTTKLAPAATGGTLLDRVRRILCLPPIRRRNRIRSLAAATLAIACIAVPLVINARQSEAADTPATSQPASVNEEYRIGPGDVLQINVDAPTKSGAITARGERVREDGVILLGLHEMKVAGLTVSELERAIEKLCRERQLIAEPRARVQVSESRRLKGPATEADRPATTPAAPDAAVSPIRPEDLKVNARDYRIGAGDLLQVGIADLVGPGVETVKSVRVSETGMISLPLVGAIKPAGLTVREAELAIQKGYQEAGLIANAQISVSVTEARGQVVNVLGPLDRPGQYQIVRPDFRVLDALAVGGGRPAEMGTLRIARRQGDQQRMIDIPLDRLIAGDADVNIVVRPGDTLIATPAKQPMKVVKIIVGKESLLRDGKPIDLLALKAMFEKMSDAERRVTVLEVAAAAPDVTVERFFNATGHLSDLVKQFNLAHLSQTGIQPTTEPVGAGATLRIQPTTEPVGAGATLRIQPTTELNRVNWQIDADWQERRTPRDAPPADAPATTRAPASAPAAPTDKPQGADAGVEDGYAKLVELARMRDQLEVGRSAYLSLGEQHPDRIKYQMMMDTMDQKIEKHLEAHPQLVGTPLATMTTMPLTPAAAEDEVLSPQLLADATRLAETDPIMQGYLRGRAQLLMQADQYDALGERHPDRIRFRLMLASANQRIRRYHQQVSTTEAATQP